MDCINIVSDVSSTEGVGDYNMLTYYSIQLHFLKCLFLSLGNLLFYLVYYLFLRSGEPSYDFSLDFSIVTFSIISFQPRI